MNGEKKHVAVLPFPFTSHPSVVSKIVLKLAAAAPEVHFSFLNTPNSNAAIFPPHAADLPNNIKIYNIEAPSGGNLLEQVESFYSTAGLTYESVLATAVEETGAPVSCFLIDVMSSFASDIASKMGVEWIALWVAAPYTLLAHIHTHAIVKKLLQLQEEEEEEEEEGGVDARKKKKKIDFVPGLSMMQVADLPGELIQCSKGNMNAIARALAELDQILPNAAAVVINSVEQETLTEVTSALRSKLRKLLQIGCPDTAGLTDQSSDSDKSGCLSSWLDQQSPNSVVYVSFGTFSMLSPAEFSAIAEALEETETPFVWSLKDQLRTDHLPAGFQERTSSHGKVVAWAPQTLILSHASVGAHLTHAGYNSMVESIVGEVPMICRPLWADNMMNARMVEEVWRIGVGLDDRVITKSGLVKCLGILMGDGVQGKRVRENIKDLKKKVIIEASGPNGSATSDFNSLVELITK